MKKYLLVIPSSNQVRFLTLRFGLLIALLCFNAGFAFSQMKISSTGNMAIDADNPVSRFCIGGPGESISKVYILNTNTGTDQRALDVHQTLTTGGWAIGTSTRVDTGTSSAKATGVYASGYKSTASSSGRSFGVYGLCGNATSGYNYGVYGQINGSNNGAAIFGATPGKIEIGVNSIYAGYFRGKVFIEENVGINTTSPSYMLDVNGTVRCVSLTQTSDLGVKKDVRNLDKTSLENLKQLQGVTYKLKTPEEMGLRSITSLASDTGIVNLPANRLSPELYEKEFNGFIAQDVAKIYPDLVSEDSEGKLSINYIGLIPVLVEAIKEQQAEIEGLKKLLNN